MLLLAKYGGVPRLHGPIVCASVIWLPFDFAQGELVARDRRIVTRAPINIDDVLCSR